MMKYILILVLIGIINNAFAQYSMAESSNDVSLPVQVSSFSASIVENKYIELHWVTESEINNQGFEIYRRGDDEKDFKRVDSYIFNNDLVGKGNTSERNEYNWREIITYKKQIDYRLIAVDFSGAREIVGQKSIDVENLLDESLTEVQVSTYPNPFNSSITLEIVALKSENIKISIINVLGKIIKKPENYSLHPGINILQWNAGDLPSNVYFIAFQFPAKTYVQKVVLLR